VCVVAADNEKFHKTTSRDGRLREALFQIISREGNHNRWIPVRAKKQELMRECAIGEHESKSVDSCMDGKSRFSTFPLLHNVRPVTFPVILVRIHGPREVMYVTDLVD
jgi:hypothetical protein